MHPKGLSSDDIKRLFSFPGWKRRLQPQDALTRTFLRVLGAHSLVDGIHESLHVLGGLPHGSHGFPQLAGREEGR